MTQPFVSAGADPLPPGGAGAEALERHVRTLVELGPRDYLHRENLDRCADYIRGVLAEAGARVSAQTFNVDDWDARNALVRLGPYQNIVADFGPLEGERIVVGAHYDVAGPNPGADDNGSGTAALLELARLLGAHPPKRRVELVAYTLEEPPFFATEYMGSAVHARRLRETGARVRGMIGLEMLGCFTSKPSSQSYPAPGLKWIYGSKGDFISVIGGFRDRALTGEVKKAMKSVPGLRVLSINAPASLPGVDFSDHRSYWAQGYRAVMVTDTAFYRNPRYHTAEDRPETLDYGRMALVTDGVLQAVERLCEAP